MRDERHLKAAGEQRQPDRAQLLEPPGLSTAPRSDGLSPDRSELFAQRLVLDLPDAGKKLCDFSDAVDGWLVCFHLATVILAKTRWLDKYSRSLRKQQDRAGECRPLTRNNRTFPATNL